MTRKTAITSVGIQEVINASATGTDKVKLTTIKISTDIIDVSPSLTDITGVVCTTQAVAGANVGDGLIHVAGTDGSQNVYEAHTVGVYTENGTLFAVVSDDEPLLQKVKLSNACIAIDIPITSVDPGYIDFGDASFTNPPATTVTAGVIKIASEQEILEGSDNSKAVSPYALKTALQKNNELIHSDGNETINGTKTFTSDVNASITGNAGSANKLKNGSAINGTNYDGSSDITTQKWGSVRNISVKDSTLQHVSAATKVDGSIDASLILPSSIDAPDGFNGNASSASKLNSPVNISISDGLNSTGSAVSFDGSKSVVITLPPYIASQLLADKTKNFGNDYYDNSDITNLIYAGNGSGTVRAELADSNFTNLHPGQYIVGKSTGTTYVVVGCNVYIRRGDTDFTTNHLGLIPIHLIGNSSSLLWSGKTYAGSSAVNTTQGYAPWSADNETEGKNVTSAYKDSYINQVVIPKVISNWLTKDFSNYGINVLTFRNLMSTGIDTNLQSMSYPSWKGACLYAAWTDCKAVLMSEPEVYGGYRWASSPYESHTQHTQLPIFRHRPIHEIIPRADIWLKDIASVSCACAAAISGVAAYNSASISFRVCPLFLIA